MTLSKFPRCKILSIKKHISRVCSYSRLPPSCNSKTNESENWGFVLIFDPIIKNVICNWYVITGTMSRLIIHRIRGFLLWGRIATRKKSGSITKSILEIKQSGGMQWDLGKLEFQIRASLSRVRCFLKRRRGVGSWLILGRGLKKMKSARILAVQWTEWKHEISKIRPGLPQRTHTEFWQNSQEAGEPRALKGRVKFPIIS